MAYIGGRFCKKLSNRKTHSKPKLILQLEHIFITTFGLEPCHCLTREANKERERERDHR